ncbi:hypothetical protein [Cupriavidus basilensis]
MNLLTGSNLVGNIQLGAGATATIAAKNTGLTLGNAIVLGASTSAVGFDTGAANLLVSGVVSGTGSLTATGGASSRSPAQTPTRVAQRSVQARCKSAMAAPQAQSQVMS